MIVSLIHSSHSTQASARVVPAAYCVGPSTKCLSHASICATAALRSGVALACTAAAKNGPTYVHGTPRWPAKVSVVALLRAKSRTSSNVNPSWAEKYSPMTWPPWKTPCMYESSLGDASHAAHDLLFQPP